MTIWRVPIQLEVLNERGRGSLSEHLGIVFTEVGENFLSAEMKVEAKVRQPLGLLHGGASAALAENVGSFAANFCVNQATHVCVGMELNINHLRPMKEGKVKAVAQPFHLGKTTQVWDIKIYNEGKELVAVSRLTMAVLERKSAS